MPCVSQILFRFHLFFLQTSPKHCTSLWHSFSCSENVFHNFWHFLLSKNWSAFLLNMPRLFWKCYCLFIKRLERQKDIKWKRILLYSDCLKITKFPQSVNNKKNIYNKLVSQKLQTGMEILTANALKIKNNFTTILH